MLMIKSGVCHFKVMLIFLVFFGKAELNGGEKKMTAYTEEDEKLKNIKIVSSGSTTFHMRVNAFSFPQQISVFRISVSKVKITLNALTLLLIMGM
jgi:hypothetical protein